MRRFAALFTVLTLFFAPFTLTSAEAAKAKVYQSFFGVAIDGTDPVGYFTEKRPVPGNSDITHKWNGATWHFSSTKNRDLFKANPEKYAPQYGGYCAWAVSQGYTASTDPNAWAVVDGKLYLNYNKSVQNKWSKDIPGNIKSADANWPKVLN